MFIHTFARTGQSFSEKRLLRMAGEVPQQPQTKEGEQVKELKKQIDASKDALALSPEAATEFAKARIDEAGKDAKQVLKSMEEAIAKTATVVLNELKATGKTDTDALKAVQEKFAALPVKLTLVGTEIKAEAKSPEEVRGDQLVLLLNTAGFEASEKEAIQKGFKQLDAAEQQGLITVLSKLKEGGQLAQLGPPVKKLLLVASPRMKENPLLLFSGNQSDLAEVKDAIAKASVQKIPVDPNTLTGDELKLLENVYKQLTLTVAANKQTANGVDEHGLPIISPEGKTYGRYLAELTANRSAAALNPNIPPMARFMAGLEAVGAGIALLGSVSDIKKFNQPATDVLRPPEAGGVPKGPAEGAKGLKAKAELTIAAPRSITKDGKAISVADATIKTGSTEDAAVIEARLPAALGLAPGKTPGADMLVKSGSELRLTGLTEDQQKAVKALVDTLNKPFEKGPDKDAKGLLEKSQKTFKEFDDAWKKPGSTPDQIRPLLDAALAANREERDFLQKSSSADANRRTQVTTDVESLERFERRLTARELKAKSDAAATALSAERGKPAPDQATLRALFKQAIDTSNQERDFLTKSGADVKGEDLGGVEAGDRLHAIANALPGYQAEYEKLDPNVQVRKRLGEDFLTSLSGEGVKKKSDAHGEYYEQEIGFSLNLNPVFQFKNGQWQTTRNWSDAPYDVRSVDLSTVPSGRGKDLSLKIYQRLSQVNTNSI